MTARVEHYLTAVDRRLPGSQRVRDEVIDELRDGLLTAINEDQQLACHGEKRVIAGFGDPAQLASTLGREIRLRMARRGALQIVVLLVMMAIAWQFYDARIGTPETMIPTGWARPAFLAGTVTIQVAPIIAQASALLFALTASLRARHPILQTVMRGLAAITVASTTAFGLSMITIMATVAPGHRAQTLMIGLPVACLSILLLHGTYRIAHHTDA